MKSSVTEELIKYSDRWVATTLDRSEIVAIGDSISEVEKKVETTQLDLDNLVITYVNPPDKFLSPHANSKV